MSKLTICSVGDLMLSDSPLYVGVGVGSAYPQIKGSIFKDCKTEFENADIVVGNFETVVYHPKRQNLAELQMSCSEAVIEELRDSGFSVLNLANNHCLQHGTSGFLYTKEICEKNGLRAIGVKDEEPASIEIEGHLILFFSICLHTEWYQPNDIQYENNIERVINKIQKMHNKNPESTIVLSVHWGDEFAMFPSNSQIEIAHKFVDYGVDIILGHHSHVFQGIEKYKNSIIVYGQGNFVSDMVPTMCRETAIVRISLDIENEKKEKNFEIIPYYISDDFVPEKSSAIWFEDRQKKLDKAINKGFPDEEYWRAVNANHKKCHNDFRVKFINSFFNYKITISLKMLLEFADRKIKKQLRS